MGRIIFLLLGLLIIVYKQDIIPVVKDMKPVVNIIEVPVGQLLTFPRVQPRTFV